jgi:hypothetical protein
VWRKFTLSMQNALCEASWDPRKLSVHSYKFIKEMLLILMTFYGIFVQKPVFQKICNKKCNKVVLVVVVIK